MQRRAIALFMAGALACGYPRSVWAQATAASDEEQSDADELVERGIALRRNGQDVQALALFRRAHELDPDSTRIEVHLAAVHHALGQWEDADRYLTRALEDPSDPYIQKHQATLATARRQIDAQIGQLKVLGGPRGGEVLLNGRSIGSLPLERAVRVEAGIYTLEVRLPGHYPITRKVALAGGELVQESIELTPFAATEPPAATPEIRDGAGFTSTGSSWLTWTFGGLALAGAGVSVAAWVVREQHADRWNDDDVCLEPSRTREQLCGSKRRGGERAETWMWIGAGSAVAFSAATIGSLWIGSGEDMPGDSALSCGVGLAAVHCAGRF